MALVLDAVISSSTSVTDMNQARKSDEMTDSVSKPKESSFVPSSPV